MPTPADIRWDEIEALMAALGVEIVERRGSRVLFRKGDMSIVVHRPHPQPEAPRGSVRRIAEFIETIRGD